jgi:thiamine-monophosphate kinase
MRIEDIGGEFALIDRLARLVAGQHADLIVGVGDDAAVIRTAPPPAPYLLVTTDILVEDRHFNRQWSRAEQIGIKAVECNVSDIAAMGGNPSWMFISLVLSESTDLPWAEALYKGIAEACCRHRVILAGGDTTRGAANVINITLLGEVDPACLCLRSGAKVGDRLAVTGTLGASAAALALLQAGIRPTDYLLEKHLAPTCRLREARVIAPLANAMIDISDGLGSEVRHICKQSRLTARVYNAALPIHPDVAAAADRLSLESHDFALSGGEDFELLFSIAPEKIADLTATGVHFYDIGEVIDGTGPPGLTAADGSLSALPGGFDHFK